MLPRDDMTRRAFALTAAGALVSASLWPTAIVRASLFGEENASLLAILAELIQQVIQATQTVQGVFDTVDRVTSVVNQGKTMLRHLEEIDSLESLLYWARGAVATLQTIDRGVTQLGYKFQQIDQQHKAVFPTRQALDAVPSREFVPTARRWNTALRESSVVAARAQTSVESLQARTEAQEKLVEASKKADGVVAQLQAVVSALAALHIDLAAIETNLAAGLRVTAAWAGEQAARNDLIDEDHKRMFEGYTQEDAPRAALTELP